MNFYGKMHALRQPNSFLLRAMLALVAAFYVLMAQANVLSASHVPQNPYLHDAGLLHPVTSGDHDHDHADSATDERTAGHHAHDHSHDKPNLPRGNMLGLVKLSEMWGIALQIADYPEPRFSFERPPRYFPVN